ncbi:MAG: hypothetical protein WCP20_03955 [Desulfuromonadales bacterium]
MNYYPKNGGLTGMNRITTDKDTTKSIKGDNQLGESMYCSNPRFLSDFILFIHVQMLFKGLPVSPVNLMPTAPATSIINYFLVFTSLLGDNTSIIISP